MSAPTNPMDVETQAFNRARVALAMVDEEASRRGWDRLKADFGYTVAARAWREAGRAIDEEAESTNPIIDALAAVQSSQAALSFAEHAARMASVRRRYAVKRAVRAGATHAEVAKVLGTSRVYVTQLVNQPEETDQ